MNRVKGASRSVTRAKWIEATARETVRLLWGSTGLPQRGGAPGVSQESGEVSKLEKSFVLLRAELTELVPPWEIIAVEERLQQGFLQVSGVARVVAISSGHYEAKEPAI